MLLCAAFAAGCGSTDDDSQGTQVIPVFELKAKVRDFKEGNATNNDGTHPHFNQAVGSCPAHDVGVFTVQPTLATTEGDTSAYPGDNKSPQLADSLPPNIAKCFVPMDRFSDWYIDRGPEINRPFYVTLSFTDDGDGNFSYRNNYFFPIDNGADFQKVDPNGPDPFGHLQTGMKDSLVDLTKHNYGFTMELHTQFTYNQGQGQFLALEGDDDLWAYINGNRVIDLGGIHAAEKDTVMLDDLGLTDKSTCTLDFYFAERAVANSRLFIITNVTFTQTKK
jgi:fibro-slime domain-containing protein